MFYIISIGFSPNVNPSSVWLERSSESREECEEYYNKYGKSWTGPHRMYILDIPEGTVPPETFPFGKHKGKKMREVDTPYLLWCFLNIKTLTPDIRSEIVRRASLRSQEMKAHNRSVKIRQEFEQAWQEAENEHYKRHRFELM